MSERRPPSNRGRAARRPSEIPPLGWRDILWRVWSQLANDHVSIAAAGVAFYAMLAIFPAITSFISIFGLFADPATVGEQFAQIRGLVPQDAWRLMNDQLVAVASTRDNTLSLGAALGLLIALWSAGAGVRALMTALNIAYRETEKRGFFRFYATAFAFTLGIITSGLCSLTVIVVVPIIVNLTDLGRTLSLPIRVLPWAVLTMFVGFTLGLLYRYGPSRREAKTRWISLGAVVATLLWLLVSCAFSFYVAHFPGYSQAYGAVGAVIVLLIWLWLNAYVVILGATLNAEMEHQTAEDTTVGDPKSLGRRGAYVADHIGRTP